MFDEFQDGCQVRHVEYQNRKILAIVNLHVAHNASHKVTVQSDKVRETYDGCPGAARQSFCST